MAFKMNSALKKQVEVAACPRAAMKMAAKDAAMKKMHSPAKAMKTPMKAMDAPTKAMKGSATKFNAELKKASAEGKLKGKFKEAVDNSPAKAMKETPAKAMKSPMKEMDPAGKRSKRDDDRKPRPRPRPKPRPRPDKREFLPGVLKENPKKKKPMIAGESATKRMESPTKAMKSPMKKDKDKATGLDKVMYYEKGGTKLEAKEGGTTKGGMKYYITQTGDAISANHVKQGRKFRGRIIEGRK
jgi:hypothetical protein